LWSPLLARDFPSLTPFLLIEGPLVEKMARGRVYLSAMPAHSRFSVFQSLPLPLSPSLNFSLPQGLNSSPGALRARPDVPYRRLSFRHHTEPFPPPPPCPSRHPLDMKLFESGGLSDGESLITVQIEPLPLSFPLTLNIKLDLLAQRITHSARSGVVSLVVYPPLSLL